MVVDDAIDLPALPVKAVGPRPGSSLPIASARPEDRVELGDALAMHTPVLLAAARVLVRNEPARFLPNDRGANTELNSSRQKAFATPLPAESDLPRHLDPAERPPGFAFGINHL